MEEHGVFPWAGESELPFVLSFTVPLSRGFLQTARVLNPGTMGM